MKKLLLLSALLIFACSSDDSTSDASNDSNSIEGRWNFISSTDCGEISHNSCDLETYMTLNNGLGEITLYYNLDENENPIPCQIVDYIDVTYSAGSNSQNYILSINGGDFDEPLSAIVDGNTLTLQFEPLSGCPQQQGIIIDEIIFTRN
jgi:hypothetical protein